MQTTQHFNPSYGLLEVLMQDGETIHVESGALVGKDSHIAMETEARGGIFKSLKRAVVGGESFFSNTFRCTGKTGTLYLAPATDGAIAEQNLPGGTMYLQRGAYLAHTGAIEMDTAWGGAKTFFSREGLFILKASGSGTIYFNSFGAIHRVDLKNQSYIVDTGYLVAWTEGLDYQVTKVGGLKSFFFSGEGLVCRMSGTGTVWIQTRAPDALAAFLHPFRRVEVRKSK
jgi:uncharacterized protein (TIGR00266 family)